MTTATDLDLFACKLDGVNLIEASAGTGKTWNICGLYLRLLLERALEVQNILVVTFTNAATAELRERIRQRIVDTLSFLKGQVDTGAGDPFVPRLIDMLRTTRGIADDTLVTRLELALASFDEAAIFTIHGFCQRALADTPFTAQMPLEMELLQDDSELVGEAANDFWRRRLAGDDIDPALAAYGRVMANGEWALEVDAELLGRLAGEGALRVGAGGRALAAVREGWGGDNLWAYFVSGSGGALQELLLALRYEADVDGMEGVSLWAPVGHPAEEDFSATGYDSEADPFVLSYFGLRL